MSPTADEPLSEMSRRRAAARRHMQMTHASPLPARTSSVRMCGHAARSDPYSLHLIVFLCSFFSSRSLRSFPSFSPSPTLAPPQSGSARAAQPAVPTSPLARNAAAGDELAPVPSAQTDPSSPPAAGPRRYPPLSAQLDVAASPPQRSQLQPASREHDDAPSSPNPMDRHWSEFVVEESANEFPMGWEQRFTATGVMYFVDHINRTTTVGRFLSSHHCPALPLCLPHGPRPALTPSALPVV